MKSAAFLLCCILGAVSSAGLAADSSAVQTVYLLPMTNGLDQYLASRLVASGLFHVTTDPKKADAVFTDRLGEAFEQRLNALLSTPDPADQQSRSAEQAAKGSSFSRVKGTIFLVDAQTRAVLWSTYEPPRNTQPKELDRTARRVVEALKRQPKN